MGRVNTVEDLEAPGADTLAFQQLARYLIIEEAARLPEHEFASFLLESFEKIVMLGDILQLPPLIMDQRMAGSMALDRSVFHRICYSPQVAVPVIALEEQARSATQIADLYRTLYALSLPKFCALDCGLRDMPGMKFNTFVDSLSLEAFGGRCFYMPANAYGRYVLSADIFSAWKEGVEKMRISKLESSDIYKPEKLKPGKRGYAEQSPQEMDVFIFLFYTLLSKLLNGVTGDKQEHKADMEKNECNLSFSVILLSLYKARVDLLKSSDTIAWFINTFKRLRISTLLARQFTLMSSSLFR